MVSLLLALALTFAMFGGVVFVLSLQPEEANPRVAYVFWGLALLALLGAWWAR